VGYKSLDELLEYVDEEDTSARHRDVIKRMADSHFKDHIIEVEDERIFRCARPGTGFYSFRICFLPAGTILIYGDIGELMLQRGGFNWLARAIRHDYVSDYVLEKARPRITWRTSQFMPGDAAAELREMHDGVPYVDAKGINFVEQARAEGEDPCEDDWERQPNPVLARKIAEDWLSMEVSGCNGEDWARAYYSRTGDCEFPDCRDYEPSILYCYHALAWFVKKRTEP